MDLRCIYCGGNFLEWNHESRCDGRQGRVEATIPEAGPAGRVQTITTPRPTSVLAFYNAVNAGILATRGAQVWAALSVMGPATANEVYEYLKGITYVSVRFAANTSSRFTKLRDLGVIREEGARPCRVTRSLCTVWAVVPLSEYAGEATVHRCTTCGQIVSRDVPIGAAK